MRKMMQPVRVVAVFLMIASYLIFMGLVRMLYWPRWPRTRLSNRILTSYCRFALWLLSVRVRVVGMENALIHKNALYVGNHVSYVDVLAFASQREVCFVTSVEVKETPGLGQIVQMAGCLFVERRSKKNIVKEVEDITEGLKYGLNVAIFPEATSSNGEQVLRFKRPLYTSAIQAERPIISFCLNYHTVGGQPINMANRDSIFWYGEMDFVTHLWRLAGTGGVDVDLHILPAVIPEKDADSAKLAELTHSLVESVFQPVRH